MKNFLKNERLIRRHDPEAPEIGDGHPQDCNCMSCPSKCLECNGELLSHNEDLCDICEERARFFDLGL